MHESGPDGREACFFLFGIIIMDMTGSSLLKGNLCVPETVTRLTSAKAQATMAVAFQVISTDVVSKVAAWTTIARAHAHTLELWVSILLRCGYTPKVGMGSNSQDSKHEQGHDAKTFDLAQLL
jgi:hypothetical protein